MSPVVSAMQVYALIMSNFKWVIYADRSFAKLSITCAQIMNYISELTAPLYK